MHIFRWFRNFQKRRALRKAQQLEQDKAMAAFKDEYRNKLLKKWHMLDRP